MEQPEPQAPHPALLAMLVCDQAIREVGTNRVTLVSIFNNIAASRFPFAYRAPLAVYARLTDAAGAYRFRLELVRQEDEHAIGQADVETTIPDRMGTHELTFQIRAIDFERPGRYEWRLFANGRYLGSMVMVVVDATQQEEEEA